MSHENQTPLENRLEVTTDAVRLPEWLRSYTLKSLLPNEVAYIPHYAMQFDAATDRVYLDTKCRFYECITELPPYITDKTERLAITLVIPVDANTDIYPYVVDATGVTPGLVGVESDLFYSKLGEDNPLYQEKLATYVPPVAVAYTNLDGQIEFHGNPAYFDALDYLVSTYQREIDKKGEASTVSSLGNTANALLAKFGEATEH